ncbi:MAG TPA: glycoside hydrolase family 3 N-terminal domain-containing protein [Gemmatimonadaceae bacterium]|nr:glycoside hydrolase family 3 N-terminal domain-containing protein [Gemmatimonadaceae bacterium]
MARRALAGALIALAACASPQGAPTAAPAAAAPNAAPASADAACAGRSDSAWVDCVLAHLTVRQKAAQMVWPRVLGDYTARDDRAWRALVRMVRTERVGGVIAGIGSPLELAQKIDDLQQASDLPLIMSADFETGAGFRARGGWFLPNAIDLGGAVNFPPSMALAATGDTMLAYQEGRVTAREGRALGVQMDFAPVLDVNNNPANPVISTRSFGEDPRTVARFGAAFLRGVQDGGMLATGKHFPGHGDTGVNSHLALPVVNASRARLDSVELVPFRAAIAAGVAAIMTFHGSMPALDSTGVPGTLSPAVLTGLLRDSLGFRGLVITDAMDMQGVLDSYGAAEAAMRAVAAGADVLLQPVDATETIDAVTFGVVLGRYDAARLDRSVRRILEAKLRLGLRARRLANVDSVRAIVGDSADQALARRVAERSITLVRDSLGQLPLAALDRGTRVLSITYAPRPDVGAGTVFDAELRRWFTGLRSVWVDSDDPAPNAARLLALADSAQVVIVGSYVAQNWKAATISVPPAFASFVEELVKRGRHPVVVALGNPYLLQQVPDVPAYVVAWSGFPLSQFAAARAVLGSARVSGRLPIGIPGLAALGAGLDRAPLPLGANGLPK